MTLLQVTEESVSGWILKNQSAFYEVMSKSMVAPFLTHDTM